MLVSGVSPAVLAQYYFLISDHSLFCASACSYCAALRLGVIIPMWACRKYSAYSSLLSEDVQMHCHYNATTLNCEWISLLKMAEKQNTDT